MASGTKISLGVLFILLVSGVIYVAIPDANIRMRVDVDKTTFYNKNLDENGDPVGRWLVAGREYNKLFQGSTLIKRRAKDIIVENFTEGTIYRVVRRTPYYNEGEIVDTYVYDITETKVELFPISHTIEIFNANTCGGKGCIYQYEVRDIVFNGSSREAVSPESFERNMRVEWQGGAYYQKIFQLSRKDKLVLKYRITDAYHKLNIRLFDPITPINITTMNISNNCTLYVEEEQPVPVNCTLWKNVEYTNVTEIFNETINQTENSTSYYILNESYNGTCNQIQNVTVCGSSYNYLSINGKEIDITFLNLKCCQPDNNTIICDSLKDGNGDCVVNPGESYMILNSSSGQIEYETADFYAKDYEDEINKVL